jgi:hypothetical protein
MPAPVGAVPWIVCPDSSTRPTPSGSASPSPAATQTPRPTSSPTTPPSGSTDERGQDRGEEDGDQGEECGWIDVACKASAAINRWFIGLVRSAIGPVFDVLGKTLLATPEISSPQMARAQSLWFTSEAIANTCFVLFVTVGGILMIAGGTLEQVSPREIVPRLVLAFIASNASLLLVGQAIKFANGLAQAFLAQGAKDADPEGAKDLLVGIVEATLATRGIFLLIVAIPVLVLALVVALTYVIRVVITMLLIIAAPLALMCHALPQTDPLARMWWRAMCGMLAIQVAQSLVFVTAITVLFAKNSGGESTLLPLPNRAELVDLLLAIVLLYILARIPFWVSRMIWQRGLTSGPLGRMAGFLTSAVIFRNIARAVTPTTGTAARPPRATHAPPPVPAPVTTTRPRPLPQRRWTQPTLPLHWPPPRGAQLELPLNPPPRPASRWTQLPLPQGGQRPSRPRWVQGELPLQVRAEQLPLPTPLPNPPNQPSLFPITDRGRRPRPRPEDFPPRGHAPARSASGPTHRTPRPDGTSDTNRRDR